MTDPHKYRIRAGDETEDPVERLLNDNIALQRQLLAEIKSLKGGNGNGGWMSRLLTERVVALIIAGMIALTVWVGATNVRLAVMSRDHEEVQERLNTANHPPQWVIDRLNDIDARIQRHLESSGR